MNMTIVIICILIAAYSEFKRRRDIGRLENRLDRFLKAHPQLREPPTTELWDEFESGTWRGHPARRNKRTNYREWLDGTAGENGTEKPIEKQFWSTLGIGYEDEFKPSQRKIAGLLVGG